MTCQDLAQRIQELEPDAGAEDVARMCLLVAGNNVDLSTLSQDEDRLRAACRDASLKIQFAADQHAAMTQELEDLASSDPKKFTSDQIWVLIRAIKVQSQVLQLYAGHPVIDV
jgi:hypothetical protein